jgi:hypothetical protein
MPEQSDDGAVSGGGSTEDQALALSQVGLSGPVPGLIADLRSIGADLTFAAECAERYSSLLRSSGDGGNHSADDVVLHALWNAGAISYRSAFASGRAHLVSQGKRTVVEDRLVDLLVEDAKAVHRDVLEMANKHVAHRVGDHEDAVIVAFLSAPPSPREVVGVGALSAHMIGPEGSVAEKLVDICRVFVEAMEGEINRLQDKLIADLKENANLDDLYRQAQRTS